MPRGIHPLAYTSRRAVEILEISPSPE